MDIRACKDKVKSPKRLAGYCVAQYCAKQTEYVRFSWSKGWCVPGFVGYLRKFVHDYGFERGIKYFDMLLRCGYVLIGGVYSVLLVYYDGKNFVEKELINGLDNFFT